MKRSTTNKRATAPRRGGAVIVVVLALLASLAFIGLFFYTLSDSELHVARSFAEAPDQVIDPDAVHNFALEQVLVSTKQQFPQSALGGGTIAGTPVSDKSILAHVIGLIRADGVPEDVRPRNGRGIGVYGTGVDGNGMPVANLATEIGFDFDGDGTLDGITGANFRFNLSSVANNGAPNFANPFERNGSPFELSRPDVDYTYPDINSPFLSYESTIIVGGTPFKVLIPSYLRPQLFPGKRSGTTGFTDLYSDANTAAQVLRPHAEHFNSDGTTRRFIDPVNFPSGRNALSGDRNRIIAPFPFSVGNNEDANNDGILDPNEDDGPGGAAPVDDGDGFLDRPNDMGVFSGPSHAYQLDVDADGDGVLDSIWLDLDHPLVELSDGRQAVPMFYVKVVDLDALLNVNHHGHDPFFTLQSNNSSADLISHVYNLTAGGIHASNTGASPAEVSPLPALSADPNSADHLEQLATIKDAATRQHRGILGDHSSYPAAPVDRTNDGTAPDGFTRVQLANLELWKLLHGSTVHNPDLTLENPGNAQADLQGRYGETVVGGTPMLRNALGIGSAATGQFPSAGNTAGFDDDGDDNNPANPSPPFVPDDNYASGISHLDDYGGLLLPGIQTAYSVHPRDFTGLGNYPPLALSYRTVNSTGAVRDLAGLEFSMPLNPSRWLYYGTRDTGTLVLTPAAWQNLDDGGVTGRSGPFPWSRGANPGVGDYLFNVSTPYDGLLNENDEIITDTNFPTQVDAPFPTSELAALQLSDQHWALIREDSRLRKLATINFEASRQAAAIRSQFTTDSRDRLEHGHSRAASANRQWEFNDDVTDATRPRFPPAFDRAAASGGPYTSRHETGVNNASDPFRPVVRRLLSIEENNQSNIGGSRSLPGQRLNLNRLLVNFDRNGNPIYRHLVPHATFDLGHSDTLGYLTVGVGGVRPANHAHPAYLQSYYDEGNALNVLDPDIPATGSYAAVPFLDIANADPNIQKFAQEAWARYDRQRLARDVFTLLYTVGGLDTDDITTAAHTGGDTNGNGIVDSVDAMAQFAVNYVDALDQDDVITRFEYDGNLADGWTDPPSPAGIVFGVESQQLAFSEVLLIQQPSATTDNDGTLHNENNTPQAEQRWLYVELRNASPFTVPLVTGSYRLARYASNETGRTGATAVIAASRFTTPTTNPNNYKRIGPGENFIVACHDGQVKNGSGVDLPSDFYANIDDALAGLEAIVPENSTSVTGPGDDPIMNSGAPHVDLDLVVTDAMSLAYDEWYENDVRAPNADATRGALVGTNPLNDGSSETFQLRLERRLNIDGFEFGEDNSTWVEVDRIEVEGRVFAGSTNTAAQIVTELAAVTSTERRQPLDDFEIENADATVRKHTMNSVAPTKHLGNWTWGTVNASDRTAGFTLWQPHFNRDFSSVYELLSIPVLTNDVNGRTGPALVIPGMADENNKRLSGWVNSGVSPRVAYSAEGFFRHPDGQTPPSASTTDDNRWYRLLEFIEYPPRTHDTIRDGQSVRRRTEARINLNTLRHEPIFAGLIDDVGTIDHFNFTVRPTQDRHEGGRIWFDQLLLARDGRDPFLTAAVGQPFPVPGVPGGMPFRSLTYIDPQANDTTAAEEDPQLQNTLLRNILGTPGFGMLEARATGDVGTDTVDYHTRNRLLAKIANNTTNRSHVFAIWVGYELFEAHQPSLPNTDIVQIGARIEDLPGHREFVVADMTRLEEAFVDDPTTADPGRFDFRKFIIYRKRIK